MKNLFQFAGAALLAATMMFTAPSCTQDPCVSKKITCANGGTCLEGVCTCVDGYQGDLCADLSRTNFLNSNGLATWKVTVGNDGCNPISYWDMIFSVASANEEMTITGMAGYIGASGNVKVKGKTFSLKANVTAGIVTITEYNGTLNTDGTVSGTFKSTDTAGGALNCSFKATKQ
jgi:hypothetical protein